MVTRSGQILPVIVASGPVSVIEVVNCGRAHPIGGADSKHGHPGEEEEAGVYDVGLFGV